MKDSLKCYLLSIGIGFVLGAVLVTNSKKSRNVVQDAQNMVQEKIDCAKEGLEKIKEKIEESVEEGKKETKNQKNTQNTTKRKK